MNFARRLPPARVGIGAPPLPAIRRGLGDTSAADTALQAMVTDITTNGCQQTAQASVSQFQTAYNAWITPGGGVNPIAVDGLYGNLTNAAAAFVNQTDGLNLTIPAGCVATAGTASPSTTSPSTSSSNVTVTTASPYTPYIVAGAVVATGLAGYALWHHQEVRGRTRRAARRVIRLRHAHR